MNEIIVLKEFKILMERRLRAFSSLDIFFIAKLIDINDTRYPEIKKLEN